MEMATSGSLVTVQGCGTAGASPGAPWALDAVISGPGRPLVPPLVTAFLSNWAEDPRLLHVDCRPSRPARFASLARPLPNAVWYRLGVEALWEHQAVAIDLLRDRRSVVVATGTASGKSLCYQAPIAEAVVEDPRGATALLVFPTKALAQDQLRALGALGIPGLTASPYDGDTSTKDRSRARQRANVVLTNPEMLHLGILPFHGRWANFLHRLRYVVLDELHVLRGVFGSHVAHVIRRLRRLCDHYGSDPTFLFSSATIGEPARLASELAGTEVTAVTDDASPRGPRMFAFWNPSAADETSTREIGSGRHTGAPRDAARLTAELIRHGHRVITFTRSRKSTELVAAEVKRRVPIESQQWVRPYRGGYLPAERREIEADLTEGRLRAVVATTALELGVDIGGLDACVLCGFPGTVASMWQQAGRAGRGDSPSLAILVGGEDQLDQWYMSHPREIFSRPVEPAVINPANPSVLVPHLACAAHELPLSHADEAYWGDLLDDGVRRLAAGDEVVIRPHCDPSGPAAIWSGRGWPARRVSMRSATSSEASIVTADGALVGTVDWSRAFNMVHPGAVYLHQGVTWLVHELDLTDHLAMVVPADGAEHTQPRSSTEISILATDKVRELAGAAVSLGAVRVLNHVTGYRRIDTFSGEVLGTEALDLPATELTTRALWVTIPASTVKAAGIPDAAVPGALHAIEHAAIGLLPLFTICYRWDVGGMSTPLLADTGQATIVIYDGYPGGAGVAELGFCDADPLLQATLDLIDSCPCTGGCPSCVQSPKCGNGNDPLDKGAAAALLCVIATGSRAGHDPRPRH